MLNKVSLIGRTTHDVELTFTKQGIPYTRLSLAVERKRISSSSEKQTDFIPIVLWRTQAEFAKNFLKKGTLVYVEGELHVNQYTNQSNQLQRTTDVTVFEIKLLESRSSVVQRTGITTEGVSKRETQYQQPEKNNIKPDEKLKNLYNEDTPFNSLHEIGISVFDDDNDDSLFIKEN